ncbi:hypothetical protein HN587_04355 [Candidatus Woesearchaeota archaeon]|jgi:hypothetical protein|nr:hypothetical protein [Candidatus Woesearchaeota archaeon]
MLKKKVKEWFNRYAFAEFIGLILAIICSYISMQLTGNIIVSGFLATWADNLGFYGTIIYRDLREKRKMKDKAHTKNYLIQLRNIFIEFGPAEYLDSFLIRPFYLIFFPYMMSNYSLAILIGTILADITFFIPTIISYEFRKKIFKN